MNFGGLVAGAIQGFAKGGEAIADDQIKRNDRMALLKAEMEAKLRQELAQEQRLGQWADKVEQGAKARGEQRDLGLVGDIRKSVPEEGPYAGQPLSEADKEMLRNLSPEQRKAFGMEDKTVLRDLQLQGEEARATGAPKAIRDGIKEGQSAEIARIKEDLAAKDLARRENKDDAAAEANNRRQEETERANRESERLRGLQVQAMLRQAGAAEMRAAGAGGGANSSEPKRTDIQAAAKVLQEQVQLELGAAKKELVPMMLSSLQTKANNGDPAAIAKMERIQPMLDALQGKQNDIINYKQPKPAAPAPAPTAPKIDTTQALSDAKRVLAINPGARDEVIRRLKAAGIDTKGL